MEIKTVIGKYRNGELAFIPQLDKRTSVEAYLVSLPLSKQIDLLCILETLMLDELREIENVNHPSIQQAYFFLLENSNNTELSDEMVRSKILTSIDRVRLGRKLRL